MSVYSRFPEDLKVCEYELKRQNVGSHSYSVWRNSKLIGFVYVSFTTVKYKNIDGNFEKPCDVKIDVLNGNDIPTNLLEKAFLSAIM